MPKKTKVIQEVSGEMIFEAYKRTHGKAHPAAIEQMKPICEGAPVFLKDLLSKKLTVSTFEMVGIKMLKFMVEEKIIDELLASLAESKPGDLASMLKELGVTEAELFKMRFGDHDQLYAQYLAGTLTVGALLVSAPGALLDKSE